MPKHQIGQILTLSKSDQSGAWVWNLISDSKSYVSTSLVQHALVFPMRFGKYRFVKIKVGKHRICSENIGIPPANICLHDFAISVQYTYKSSLLHLFYDIPLSHMYTKDRLSRWQTKMDHRKRKTSHSTSDLGLNFCTCIYGWHT